MQNLFSIKLDFKEPPKTVFEFLTKSVRTEYPKMPNYFKNLVPESHPLMPFYIALTQSSISDIARNTPLLQLRNVLTNNFKFQCECGAISNREDAFNSHGRSCVGPRLNNARLLTLDGVNFMC